jgi:sugar phosphate permease
MSSDKVLVIEDHFDPANAGKAEDDIIEFTEAERRRIVRKVDIHLLPFISALYLLSFLDRANIGNAKIAGMVKDAHLTGLKYNIIAAVFFIPYALAEVPSNVLLKLMRPSRWIPSIMVAWGLIMTLMCLCKTFKSLLIARVFLGLAESGLFPGVTFYLSLWYRRQDVALRIAIFFSAATVAGAFGGILAYGIEHMEGIGGLHGWQWIFCLEGLVTLVVAFLSYFFMHDYPSTATFLTPHEKQILVQILKDDTLGLATHYDMKFVWQALLDYKSYVFALLYISVLVPVYAIALFLPTIINALGFSAGTAQLLTIPPFAIGCFATITVGYYSDTHRLRGPYVIGSIVVALVGYIVLITQKKAGVSYAGTIIATVGAYPTIAVILAWVGASVGGDIRKGVTFAIVIGLGNLGGICSSFIYLKAPRFFVGHGTIIGFLTLGIILCLFCMWNFNRLNKTKEAYCVAHGLDDSQRSNFAELGSESPLFRYII